MRRLLLIVTAASSLVAGAASAQMLPVSQSPVLGIGAGQATRIQLSAPVRDIVVGNPSVADVNVIDARTLVVMGKKAGATTLLAFDAGGRTLADRQIMVSDLPDAAVVVQRGVGASAYACASHCTKLTGGDQAGAPAASPAP